MATLKKAAKPWRPLFALERIISRDRMRQLRYTFATVSILTTGISIGAWYSPAVPHAPLWYGIALISWGLWLEQILLYAYHNHRYFAGLHSVIGRTETTPSPITYDVAQIVTDSPEDLTAGFLIHSLGHAIWQRAELNPTEIADFIATDRTKVTAQDIVLPGLGTFSMANLGIYLATYDPDLRQYLDTHGITPANFIGAVRWVVAGHIQTKLPKRWWSKDMLLRTGGIGKTWSYGYTNTLNRFLKPVQTSAVFSVFGTVPQYAAAKVDDLSTNLLQEKAGNVLIIGADGVGKTDVVIALEKQINAHQAPAGLQHKRIAVLDTERLLAFHDQTAELEQALLTILQEATTAGNNIIVIEHISTFITAARERGVRIPEMLDTYLAHPDIQFIATDTPGQFHHTLQPLGGFIRRFGQVVIDTPDTDSVVRILQQSCPEVERTHNTLFTYPALVNIAQGAKRYITDGVPPDSAVTLMVEIGQHHAGTVTSQVVQTYLKEKTGIPMGAITEEERDVLLHLEDTLHGHVIGQDAAITALGKTIRRARVGIQNSERPLGSFLFLGPTGVGKTETAKTLALIFFGSADKMVRFDMSEYSAPDALDHIIGHNNDAGTLSTALHDHPYCVLLLDEFEKAHQSIHDLFLQVLDEGQFTDGRGTIVNARNTIVIATANAGSELIYRTTGQRTENPSLNQQIIDHIISTGHFRPELINRFDSTIIFEPLTKIEQRQIATLMIKELTDRLADQTYTLVIAPDVLDYVIEHGYSEQFGARAMRREIQDIIEAAVAEKIILHQHKPGDTIRLDRTDIET